MLRAKDAIARHIARVYVFKIKLRLAFEKKQTAPTVLMRLHCMRGAALPCAHPRHRRKFLEIDEPDFTHLRRAAAFVAVWSFCGIHDTFLLLDAGASTPTFD
jgi:hypothetical protein